MTHPPTARYILIDRETGCLASFPNFEDIATHVVDNAWPELIDRLIRHARIAQRDAALFIPPTSKE